MRSVCGAQSSSTSSDTLSLWIEMHIAVSFRPPVFQGMFRTTSPPPSSIVGKVTPFFRIQVSVVFSRNKGKVEEIVLWCVPQIIDNIVVPAPQIVDTILFSAPHIIENLVFSVP